MIDSFRLRQITYIHNFIRRFRSDGLYRTPFASKSDVTEADHAGAREWLKDYHSATIPRRICEISFSRSSGPGGQNVNKVNSKATLRIPFKELLPLVPSMLHGEIRASQYCAEKSDSLVIQADNHRKQGDNVTACFAKLQNLFVTAGRTSVKGETSPEQRERVKRLQKADNEARLSAKKRHSSKKSARQGGSKFNY
ncbi:MAG: hypothetical protein Q9225_001950 [Loekoesia sp. 1 TL-2023]